MKYRSGEKKLQAIIRGFKQHCVACQGVCCHGKDLSVFDWELKKLPKYKELVFLKSGGFGKSASKKAGYISLSKGCPFLGKVGCKLSLNRRPIDCLSYPIYPLFRFYYSNRKELAGMLVHKSCALHNEISMDNKLIGLMRNLWEEKLEKMSKSDVLDWLGGKRDYWLDKNVIKVRDDK